ncbi:MAG: hypothetical protein ABJO36_09575 [Litorimonas sp.]
MLKSKIVDGLLVCLTVLGTIIIVSNFAPDWLGMEAPMVVGMALVFFGVTCKVITEIKRQK